MTIYFEYAGEVHEIAPDVLSDTVKDDRNEVYRNEIGEVVEIHLNKNGKGFWFEAVRCTKDGDSSPWQ